MSEPRTARIGIRTTPAVRNTLRCGATMSQQSVSEFLLDAGIAAAQQVLADRMTLFLDEERWQAFQKGLDRPVRPKPRLARLLRTPTVLD